MAAAASTTDVYVYRIGWWTHRWWPSSWVLGCLFRGRQPNGRKVSRVRYLRTILRDLKRIRFPHRPWQSEYDDCRWCRRGWTAEQVRRLATADLHYQQRTGQWSPWVSRRVRSRYGMAGLKRG